MKGTKKLLLALSFVLLGLALVACGSKSYTVSFDTDGGSAVAAQTVKKGEFANRPEENPTRGEDVFVDWFANEDLSGDAFTFRNTEITKNTTLHAKWLEVNPTDTVVRFEDHRQETTNIVVEPEGQTVAEPAAPTRSGYRFGGWFTTKRGLSWTDTEKVAFPLTLAPGSRLNLYAYWEPVNSVDVNWTANETYRSTITAQSRMVLNPLTYENNLENDLIANMATSLYSTEVDWGLAIEQGVADFPGDFSKIEAGEFSIEALDYKSIMVGAARYPLNHEGDDLLNEDGEYDREAATTVTSTEWTFTLRDDIKFQDGTPITAHTYEYTLQQYIDQDQNNYRANTMYRTLANPNGVPILNSFEYFSQSRLVLDEEGKPVVNEEGEHVYEPATVTWEEVGFEVLDDYTFKMTFHTPYSQAAAVSFGTFRLVHPEKYGSSLDAQGNTNYGTPSNPYMSYGAYVLKAWSENAQLIFNKNYDYVAKETINYKSLAYEIVENTEQTLNLYRDGGIDVIGLNANNYDELSETGNIYRSFTGYPIFLTINTAPSTLDGDSRHVPDTIIYDKEFRQALMFGFDRNEYNANYDIPNVSSFIPVPGDIKNYVQDTEFFTDSPQYLKVLQDLGVDPNSMGFLPNRALDLFDSAYDRWIAAGNEGPATLKLIAPDSTIATQNSARIKAMYESFFEKDGVKRLVIDVHNLASAQRSQTSAAWDFDITVGGIGFGGSLGTYWQMGAISFAGGNFGGASLGLSQPYTTDPETGERVLAEYATQVIDIDLTATYNYLVSRGGMKYLEDNELTNTQTLFEWLQEEKDENGVVTKPAGIARQQVLTFATFLMTGDEPWDSTAKEPFPGAGADANNIAAAMLEVFYEHVTHVPTGTSASATLYAPKVTVEWPEYSTAFGWGAARYRYLNTDVDFQ